MSKMADVVQYYDDWEWCNIKWSELIRNQNVFNMKIVPNILNHQKDRIERVEKEWHFEFSLKIIISS